VTINYKYRIQHQKIVICDDTIDENGTILFIISKLV